MNPDTFPIAEFFSPKQDADHRLAIHAVNMLPKLKEFVEDHARGTARNIRRLLDAGNIEGARAVVSVFEINTEAILAEANNIQDMPATIHDLQH